MKVTAFPSTVSGVSERMIGFTAHLRYNGVNAGITETTASLRSLRHINSVDADEVRLACKSVYSGCQDQYFRFDELFDSYWFNRGREKQCASKSPEKADARDSRQRHSPGVDESQRAEGNGDIDQADNENTDAAVPHSGAGRLIASGIRNLEKTDFREFVTPESIADAETVARQLANAMRDRRTRRYRASQQRKKIDLRKTIRSSVSCGGVPLKLHYQHHPDRSIKLVAILDVSGSMTVYARVFLSFIKGLMNHDLGTDAYLFHTHLVRISDTLRDKDTLRALNRLTLMAQGFGGGTRIGSCLKRFNEQYADNVNGRTVVMVLSDGYDTGRPIELGQALEKLKKKSCKIIWLNPLKGWNNYQPVAEGMAAALPWIDHFAAANTLESLAALEPELKRL